MPSFDQEMSPLESGEAEPPQIRRPLMSPSDAERRRHETSHLPFREWREHCVRGRGRAMPHFSRQRRGAEESVPVVQLDYTYMKGVSGPKALSIVDRDTSYGTSSVVLAKGSSDRYAVAMGVQFLDHLGHEEVILQSDAEPAAVDVARAIAKSFKGRAIVREVPRDSSRPLKSTEFQMTISFWKDCFRGLCDIRVGSCPDFRFTQMGTRHTKQFMGMSTHHKFSLLHRQCWSKPEEPHIPQKLIGWMGSGLVVCQSLMNIWS